LTAGGSGGETIYLTHLTARATGERVGTESGLGKSLCKLEETEFSSFRGPQGKVYPLVDEGPSQRKNSEAISRPWGNSKGVGLK